MPPPATTARPIVIVALMQPQGPTGLQTHVRMLCAALDAAGQPWRLVTPFDAVKPLLWPLLALRRLLEPVSAAAAIGVYRRGHAWLLAGPLRRVLAAQPDAVIVAHCPVSAATALRCRAPQGQPVTLVVHFNGSQADEWVGKGRLAATHPLVAAMRRFEDDVLGRVDTLVFVSAWMQRQLTERLPSLQPVAQAVVPNFIADPAPEVASMSRPRMRDLIAIGTLEPRKNIAYLLDILAAARGLGPALTLTVVGDGPQRTELQARARRMGLASQVFFAGHVPAAIGRIPAHRALIHVASVESFGMVLIEAMACGRPVFATVSGGMAEVFQDGIDGVALPAGDPVAAAHRLCGVLAVPEQMAALGRAGRVRFERDYAQSVVGERLRRQVLSARRQTACAANDTGMRHVA